MTCHSVVNLKCRMIITNLLNKLQAEGSGYECVFRRNRCWVMLNEADLQQQILAVDRQFHF